MTIPRHYVPHLHIAIDGPVASGKSVVSDALARRLGIFYLDTGIMYRAVAFVVLLRGLDRYDEAACGMVAETLDLRIIPPPELDGRQPSVFIGHHDITPFIRTPLVNRNVSLISSHPRVRSAMHEHQRAFASQRSVVMAGRDIASVVMPDAQVKIMLDASLDERVRRRACEMQAQAPDMPMDLAVLRQDIMERDAKDQSQMRLTPQTLTVTTDGMTVDAVIDRLLSIVQEAIHEPIA